MAHRRSPLTHSGTQGGEAVTAVDKKIGCRVPLYLLYSMENLPLLLLHGDESSSDDGCELEEMRVEEFAALLNAEFSELFIDAILAPELPSQAVIAGAVFI